MQQPDITAALSEPGCGQQQSELGRFVHSTLINNMRVLQLGPSHFHQAPTGAWKRWQVSQPHTFQRRQSDAAAAAAMASVPASVQSASSTVSSVATGDRSRARVAATDSSDDFSLASKTEVHRITAKRTMRDGSAQYKGQRMRRLGSVSLRKSAAQSVLCGCCAVWWKQPNGQPYPANDPAGRTWSLRSTHMI